MIRELFNTLFWTLMLSVPMVGQQTIGLFQNDSLAANGYTLFAPSAYRTTYLIDNCGFLVNSWTSQYRPGQSAYLLEDGSLIRTARINSTFSGGGTGGRIEKFNWEGDLVWAYNYSSQTYHQHHDIEVLPNGNVLILAWELRTPAEAIQAGRNPDFVSNSGIWSERVVEVMPVGADGGEIVWEWHLWDHLIQDHDTLSNNFGVVSEHPELIDLNFPYANSGTDWIHANSIDYNPELDQIMINSRDFEEFWIIDHSTTTEEAASHTGGTYGRGGDILYRWGNPQAYKRGDASMKVFSLQHDAHWIPAEMPGEGQIMVFNNGVQRPEGQYSSIDIIASDINPDGSYFIDDDAPFGPDTLLWSYDGGDTNSFYSPRLAGAQRMPNGNTLVCVGATGAIYEIDSTGRTVWLYQNPVGVNGPVKQGFIPPSRDMFRAYRYTPDYPGFAGRDLTPGDPIELEPLPSTCMIWEDSTTTSHPTGPLVVDVEIYPNPTTDLIWVQTSLSVSSSYSLFDQYGRSVDSGSFHPGQPISCGELPAGIYFLRIFDPQNQVQGLSKVIVR